MARKKSGGSCKLCARQPGRCPTHNVDLTARNRKANLASQKNDPVAFLDKCRRGYQTTVTRHGLEAAREKLREYRIKNPFPSEIQTKEILDVLHLTYQEQVYPWQDTNHSVDFIVYANGKRLARPLAIEANGHQWKPSFGEFSARAEKQDVKLARLQADGMATLVLDWRELDRWESQVSQAIQQVGYDDF